MSYNNKMRLTLITLGSTLATTAVILNAFYQKKQFYPSIVYLTKSNPSIAVVYAQAFVAVFLIGKALRKIFFGQLRAAELEHLIEKFWYVITETCLAFTVFRDDFSSKFVALFTFLLFMKAFHWLIEDRVDYMERTPIITLLFHARVVSLLLLLGTLDSALIHHAFRTTLASGASVQMVFGFEYSILLAMVVAIVMKYVLHTIDNQNENPWENKNVYLLYVELVIGFVKCCLYIVFVGVMVKIHTFPLFAIRPMYLTIRTFKKSLSDVILSRRAIAYMNTRFPEATTAELNEVDNTCIICRDQMFIGKKLPCNHIFHSHCLRSWFQRQQSCPTCRLDVLSPHHTTQTQQPAANQNAQQQQQNPPPVPGFMGMPPAPAFGMYPPPPQPPQIPQPPTSTGASSTASNAFTFPQNNLSMPPFMANNFMAPPFMSPPPGPPFMGFGGMSPTGVAPGMFGTPNVDLANLTEEQLNEMEGQERANVEARIHVLKNVHSLLDVAIIQLNQYSQIIQNINAVSQPEARNDLLTPLIPTLATKSSVNNTNTTPATSTVMSNISMSEDEPGPSCSNHDLTSLSGTDGVENIGNISDNENEIRKRRLEKFQQSSTTAKTESSNN